MIFWAKKRGKIVNMQKLFRSANNIGSSILYSLLRLLPSRDGATIYMLKLKFWKHINFAVLEKTIEMFNTTKNGQFFLIRLYLFLSRNGQLQNILSKIRRRCVQLASAIYHRSLSLNKLVHISQNNTWQLVTVAIR